MANFSFFCRVKQNRDLTASHSRIMPNSSGPLHVASGYDYLEMTRKNMMYNLSIMSGI